VSELRASRPKASDSDSHLAGDKVKGESPVTTIQSVSRAILLLQHLADSSHDLGVSDLARLMNTTKTTVHRLLAVLRDAGLVAYSYESRRYRLGYRILHWASVSLRQTSFIQVCHPHMVRLRDLTGESVLLHVRAGAARVCVHIVESRHELCFKPSVGEMLPLNRAGAGRILMAGLSLTEFEQIMRRVRWDSAGPNAILDSMEWRKEVERAARDGYSIAEHERVLGISGVNVPIRDVGGSVIAVLNVAGPSVRLDRSRLESFVEDLLSTASSISADLGCSLASPTDHSQSNGLGVNDSLLLVDLVKG